MPWPKVPSIRPAHTLPRVKLGPPRRGPNGPDFKTEVLQSMDYDPVRAFIRRRRMSGWSISKIYWLGFEPGRTGFAATKLEVRSKDDGWPSMTLEEYQKVCDIIFGE